MTWIWVGIKGFTHLPHVNKLTLGCNPHVMYIKPSVSAIVEYANLSLFPGLQSTE